MYVLCWLLLGRASCRWFWDGWAFGVPLLLRMVLVLVRVGVFEVAAVVVVLLVEVVVMLVSDNAQ